MTATGLITALLFFFISQAKPLQKLSPFSPPSSIFAKSVIISICGQFLVHFLCIYSVLHICREKLAGDLSSSRVIPDAPFQANLVNSCMYLLHLAIQNNNFVINYRGAPFTMSIWDNKMLWRSVQILYALLLLLVSDTFPPVNDLLQLVRLPNDIVFQYQLGLILVFDLTLLYLVEKGSQLLEKK